MRETRIASNADGSSNAHQQDMASTPGVTAAQRDAAPDVDPTPVVSSAATAPRSSATGRLVGRWTMAAVFLGGLFAFASVAVLIAARPVLVPVVAAAVLAMTLTPVVQRLRRWGISQPLAAVLVACSVVLGVLGLVRLLVEPLGAALDAIPALEGLGGRLWRLCRALFGVPYADWLANRIREVAGNAEWSTALFGGLWEATTVIVTTFVLMLFLLMSGDLFLQKLVRVLPRVRNKVKAVRVVKAVQEDISRYFVTVTLINAGLGTTAGLIAWYWELPSPLLWAVVVAVLNYLPYVGAVANVTLLLAASAATYATLPEILVPPAVFAAIVVVEGQFVTPLAIGRRTQLNAVTVVVGLLFWAWAWGIAGLVLAVPLLLVVKGFAAHVEQLEAINEFIGK